MIKLYTAYRVRHHVLHEALGLLVNLFSVDQDFSDVLRVIVADCTNHQARFLINQQRRLVAFGRAINGSPQLQQVVQVPLQLFRRATDASGAGDGAHAVGHFELCHRIAQFVAVFAFDAARNATTAWVVRHQHQIATGQRDEAGERGTLVAAFVFFDLNDDFLTDPEIVRNLVAIHLAIDVHHRAGNFFERQKAVPLGAVVDETGFE